MPTYGLLGIEIFIPSINDIVYAVLAPVNNLVWSAVDWVKNALVPFFSDVVNTVGSALEGAVSGLTGLVSNGVGAIQDVLSGVSGALSGLPNIITGGLDSLGSGLFGALDSLGSGLEGALGGAQDFLSGAINTLGSSLEDAVSGAVDFLGGAVAAAEAGLSDVVSTVGNGITGALAFMEANIGGALTSILSGFGSADVGGIVGSAVGAAAQLLSAFISLPVRHSPLEPEDTVSWVSDFEAQVEAACVTLHIANTIAEAASLGQIDVSLEEAWRYPYTAAAINVAQTFASMPLLEGLGPAFKRYILSSYQPNIPDFQSLMSIYVKEGYLEDHWVELPEEMVKNFSELGFNAYWARRLWGMHWQYPGPSQLFEMLHRTAGNFPEIGVTPEVLADMLKLHDYEPKWRSPLAAISWNTWRIYDIRIGWEMGLLDDDAMLKRLIDAGYVPEDSAILVDVQKMFVLRSEIDGLLSEADLDFVDGWIDELQLQANYDATPYNAGVKTLRVARAKSKRERAIRTDLLAALEDRFIKGDLAQPEFELALSNLGMIQTAISSEVERQLAKKLTKVKEETTTTAKALTEATYSRAFRVGLITEDVYRADLAALKYTAEDIDLLVELNTPEKPPPDVVKTLTVAELKAAFRAEVLSEEELRSELASRRYLEEDVNTIVETEKAKIKPKVEEAGVSE
jgi:hypothetical protein